MSGVSIVSNNSICYGVRIVSGALRIPSSPGHHLLVVPDERI